MVIAPAQPAPSYQVGGSLPVNAPSYVRRAADEELFAGLRQGEFCYVLNARQMGKSSLRVQTMHRLQQAGVRCGVVDMTAIGTQLVTPAQWYASIAGLLCRTLQLPINVVQWWRDREALSWPQRLDDLLETVVLRHIAEPIVVFIDEIDSVLGLPFATDDFFALIRACYNKRADRPDYQRLTFALLGVTTPSQLIADKTRTPFNLGRAIALSGFTATEASPLLPGLAAVVPDPTTTLQEILKWTGGQPFLTQKVCQLVVQAATVWPESPAGNGCPAPEAAPTPRVERLIATHILENWQTRDEPEHLRTIRDRLLYNEHRAGRLLGLYQQIVLHAEVPAARSPTSVAYTETSADHTELLLSGLVEQRAGKLQVKNQIYRHIFDLAWVTQQLANLRPYGRSLQAWVDADCAETSWLLRGQALEEATTWAQHKSLSDLDYRFLAASQALAQQEIQAQLEADRLQAVEAKLYLEQQRSREQRRHLRRQRGLLGIVTAVLCVAIGLGILAYQQYQQTALSEVKALALSSEALFASHKKFDAVLQAIKAKERLQRLTTANPDLEAKVDAALWRVLLSIQEKNRLNGHSAAVLAIAFSPDQQQIASTGVDGTIKLWRPDGTLLKTLTGHTGIVYALKFSPDGTRLISGDDKKSIRIWKPDGTLIKTIQPQASAIWSLAFSPDSSTFISGGPDSSVEVWSRDGVPLQVLPGRPAGVRGVAFSPDGRFIAAGNTDSSVSLWSREGQLLHVLRGHEAAAQVVGFVPNRGKQAATVPYVLVSGGTDGVIKFWATDGTLLNTIQAHPSGIWGFGVNPTQPIFASASHDKTVKLWSPEGQLLKTLQGHDAAVWGIAVSLDGEAIASGGSDNTVILWKTKSPFQRTIYGITDITTKLVFLENGRAIASVGNRKYIQFWGLDGTARRVLQAHAASTGQIALSPDGQILASTSEDKTLKLWRLDGSLLRQFDDATATLMAVSWHPDGKRLVTSSADGSLWLWHVNGKLLKHWQGHMAPIWDAQFSPDGQLIASGGTDKILRLWRADGTAIAALEGHTAPIWRVAFSPDGQLLASASADMTVRLWTRQGHLKATLTGHQGPVWGVTFNPEGTVLATASLDETIKLWTPAGQLLATLEGHTAGVRTVAFHPTLPLLASAGDDQTIRLWNLEQILQLQPLPYACNWVRDYLATNPTVESGDRALCAHSH